MKKFIALALAMVLALTVCAAFAEETVTLKIAHIGPLTGPAACTVLPPAAVPRLPLKRSTPLAESIRSN